MRCHVRSTVRMDSLNSQPFIIDREAREIMYLVASVRPSVRPSVCPSVCMSELSCLTSLLPCFRVKVKGRVKVMGQGQRSQVKVKGQGQISGAQRSILGARLCRVQQRAIRVITSVRCLCVCNQWA